MAKEITVKAQMQCRKGHFYFPLIGAQDVKIDQVGLGGGAPGIVEIGPADELVDLSEIASPGYVWMKNVDQVQTVLWGPNNGGSMLQMGRMRPGGVALFELSDAAGLRMQVDPATDESDSTSAENRAKVQIFVLER